MLKELTVFFAAMIPQTEIKLAIPLGKGLGMSAVNTYLFAVAGNLVAGAIILFTIEALSNFLRKKSKRIDVFFEKIFTKTCKKNSKRFEIYGEFLIFLVVALPIPGSGAGAGAIIALLFKVNYWKAFALIAFGIAAEGLWLIAGVESIFSLFKCLT